MSKERSLKLRLLRFSWRGVYVRSPNKEKRIIGAVLLLLFALMAFLIGMDEIRLLRFVSAFLVYCAVMVLVGFAFKRRAKRPGWLVVCSLPVAFADYVLHPLFRAYTVIGTLILLPSVLAMLVLKPMFTGTAPKPAFIFMWLTFFTITITYSAESMVTTEFVKARSWVRFILKPARIKLVNFILYFLLLVGYSALNLGGKHAIGDKDLELAVLQSFAAYVAFDRIISNWKKS